MSVDHGLLLRRLVDLALREREYLRAESWEDALDVRGLYDENFAQLQRQVGKVGLAPDNRNDLVRLQRLHEENVSLAHALRHSAGAALAELNKVQQIGSYAPMGSNHKPAPRYLDESA